jgi:hypothetical protein
MSDIPTCQFVLLIGAGFTKDFGGYLVKDIDAPLWNDASKPVRDWILRQKKIAESKNESYHLEQIYDDSLTSLELKDQEKCAVRASIIQVFAQMDREIRDRLLNSPHQNKRIPSCVFSHFVSYFSGEQHHERGFLFIPVFPSTQWVEPDQDNRKEPHGETWTVPCTTLARLYDMTVVGVSNVG